MKPQNDLFRRLAIDILATSKLRSAERTGGLGLYDSFCNVLFSKYKIKPIQQKFITAFYKGEKNIFSIAVQANAIKITLNVKKGMLKDDKKIFRDVSKIGHLGSGDYQVKLENDDYFDYVVELIKQIS